MMEAWTAGELEDKYDSGKFSNRLAVGKRQGDGWMDLVGFGIGNLNTDQ